MTTNDQPLLAWHGDQALRDRIVARMHQHRAADSFTQGYYQLIDPNRALGYRGCAIGCLLDQRPRTLYGEGERPGDGWWAEVERQFGISASIAAAVDSIFESFPLRSDASDFAVAVAEAIAVGADLSAVAAWCYEYLPGGVSDSDELLERLRSAPVPVREG